ncbi:class I SAM-dependent methyltransferase [Kitasatospora kifunensis]|uniref:2-polyprenyl-3-methyl-5-hydroxy-6-metoxy-1, 4-benzoquinol methylase n=1 Tax=Kitasatospora kifunensis TaxID=58351 RepID=A0A7W7R729_KITKI|nr:class I SAM-dependent methyltransferase [Kitasatospora kifunensis]MBB4926628.1 2-polyprenyl-3-methyl-5-hydroxy-6-metoxy-1,4-benzoquinol methylase [Kitasatospora kifunensis]
MTVDEDRVMEFLGRVVTDGGAAVAGLCTSLGDRLGLYAAMAGAGPLTADQLAERTGLHTRYLREWLAAQVAGEYVEYDAAADSYLLPDEHAAVLADPAAPTYAAGFFTMMQALYGTEDLLMEAFRTGRGVGWEEHGEALFAGTAKFFRPGYEGALVPEWIPAMNGTERKLRAGAEVADVGCGYGWSTMLMAKAYPASHFHGFDFHRPSIEAAGELAEEQGLADRVSFEVAGALDFPGEDYDLITFFDCLHDMGDPGSALHHAEQALAPDGACMIVEPNVSADVRENANPIGRAVVSASVAICLPAALAQHGPQAMGNHAGEDAMRHLADDAGLHHWKLAAESPLNRVYAASR